MNSRDHDPQEVDRHGCRPLLCVIVECIAPILESDYERLRLLVDGGEWFVIGELLPTSFVPDTWSSPKHPCNFACDPFHPDADPNENG